MNWNVSSQHYHPLYPLSNMWGATMTQHGHAEHITDEDRREFLKALGVTGAITAGGVTLNEIREEIGVTAEEEFAPIVQGVQTDLEGTVDTQLISGQQTVLAEAVTELPVAVDKGFPTEAQRDEFARVADAGQPIYDHLTEIGFFESTTEHLPEFSREYLNTAISTFIGSETLATSLETLGKTGQEGVDLMTVVFDQVEQLTNNHHWVATDGIPRAEIEWGEHIPPMTQGAAGGSLLWFDAVDLHLYQKKVLITDEILAQGVWDGQAIGAGFYLMSEGAKALTEESTSFSDGEIGALLSVGFALQTASQIMLKKDLMWITEEMRAPRRTDLEIPGYGGAH